MRKALILLVVLVGGLIVADRLGVRMAQNTVAKQVAAQYQLDRRPTVTIHGFPFITQAIGGEYQQIDVALGEWSEHRVTVHDAELRLSGVRAPFVDVINGNSSQIMVRSATAAVTVPYAALRRYAPQGVEQISANGSDLQTRISASFFGAAMSADVVTSVRATERGIAITPKSISSGGAQVPLSILRQRYAFTVPTGNLLPLGVRVTDIQVLPTGLRITASADDLRLENLAKG